MFYKPVVDVPGWAVNLQICAGILENAVRLSGPFSGPTSYYHHKQRARKRDRFLVLFSGPVSIHFLHLSSSFRAGFGLLLVLRLGSRRWRAAFRMEGHRRPLAAAAMAGAIGSSSTKLLRMSARRPG